MLTFWIEGNLITFSRSWVVAIDHMKMLMVYLQCMSLGSHKHSMERRQKMIKGKLFTPQTWTETICDGLTRDNLPLINELDFM